MSSKHHKKSMDEAMFSMFGVSKAEPAEEQMLEQEEPKPVVKTQPVPVPTPDVPKPTNTVTYFATDSVVEGTVKTEGDVEIAGPFHGEVIAKGKVILRSKMEGNITAASLHLMGCTLVGNITSQGSVMVDEAATITGNITAGELVSSGTIKGDLNVKDNLTLNAHATVEGNITTGTMSMMQGALITGDVKMGAK